VLQKLLTGAVLFVGLSLGWQLRATWSLMGQTRAARHVVETVERQAAVSSDADVRHQRKAAAARIVYRTLYREVPVYVPQTAVARCDVPLGFVRLLDAAALGVPAVPGSAGRPHDAPAGIGLDTVAGSVVDNYETCNAVRAQLSGLQDWVRRQGG